MTRTAVRMWDGVPGKSRLLTIGYLKERVFIKEIEPRRHFFRKFKSWGIDADSFDNIIEGRADYIVIEDITSSLTLGCSIERFRQFCVEHFTRYWRRQYLLRHEFWDILDRLTMRVTRHGQDSVQEEIDLCL